MCKWYANIIYDLWDFCKTIAKTLKNIVDFKKDSRILKITEFEIQKFLDTCFMRYEEAKIEPGKLLVQLVHKVPSQEHK